MNFKQCFGKQLQKLRKSRNITQEKLAELVDIHPRQISKIETGDNFPKSNTLENLCINLEVHPRDLFDFDFITGITKNIEYFSDKTSKILDTTNKKEIEDLVENVKELSKDKQYLDFLKLSVGALKNTDDLSRLEMLIAGIKLARKK